MLRVVEKTCLLLHNSSNHPASSGTNFTLKGLQCAFDEVKQIPPNSTMEARQLSDINNLGRLDLFLFFIYFIANQ